jgi:hypothetical protein
VHGIELEKRIVIILETHILHLGIESLPSRIKTAAVGYYYRRSLGGYLRQVEFVAGKYDILADKDLLIETDKPLGTQINRDIKDGRPL